MGETLLRSSPDAKAARSAHAGKTAPIASGRRIPFLAVAFPAFVRHLPGLYVDLGYGASPRDLAGDAPPLAATQPEADRAGGRDRSRARWRRRSPHAGAGSGLPAWRLRPPLARDERVSVIRAFNVLRQYDETAAVAGALATLGGALTEDGLLLEGTSDLHGRLLAF